MSKEPDATEDIRLNEEQASAFVVWLLSADLETELVNEVA